MLILTALLAGCVREANPSIQVCGFSDSISENPHTLEYSEWSKGFFQKENVEKNVTLSIGNKTITGEYVKSERRVAEFYDTHRYKDNNGYEFALTDDGTLSWYFYGSSSSDQSDGKRYTEAECRDIACAYLSEITDISDYTVTVSFDEGPRLYRVAFRKYAGGFQCADLADISVEESGHIYSFSSTLLGRMPKDAAPDFDREDIQKQLTERLDKEYEKAKERYDKVVYDNFQYELTMDEQGQYALVVAVDVDCIQYRGEYTTKQSERIRFLVR